MLKLTFLIFVLFYSNVQAQSNYEYLLRDTSLDKKSLVTVFAKDTSDAQRLWKYILTFADKSFASYAYIITEATTHDSSPPLFFWNKNSTKLIYETCPSKDNDWRQIKIYDLINKKVLFTTAGFINDQFQNSSKYFDLENNILIYFLTKTGKETAILSLNISTQKINKLETVSISGDQFYPISISKVDKKKRIFSIKYQDTTYNEKYLDLKY
jgi:hypothetical protein